MKSGYAIWKMLAALLIVAGSTIELWAHPGHSHLSEGFTHALFSGYHIAGLASVGALMLAVGWFARQNKWAARLQKAGAASLLAAAALWIALLV